MQYTALLRDKGPEVFVVAQAGQTVGVNVTIDMCMHVSVREKKRD